MGSLGFTVNEYRREIRELQPQSEVIHAPIHLKIVGLYKQFVGVRTHRSVCLLGIEYWPQLGTILVCWISDLL